MRILVVSSDARPRQGGIATCLDGWTNGLRRLGHAASTMALLPADVAPPIDADPADVLVRMPTRRLSTTAPTVLRKTDSGLLRVQQWAIVHAAFVGRIRSSRPDWVIFGTTDAVSCLPLRFARAVGLRCAGVVYGTEIRRPHGADRRRLLRRLARFDRVIAISRYSAAAITELGFPEARTHVVHPPVTIDVEASDLEQSRPLIEGPTIVTVARLVPRKGIDLVLAAVHALRAAYPGLRYNVVGDGPERQSLERMAGHLGITERVRFHGAVSDAARDRIVADADVFVMTPCELADGDVEGFGIVYLEAGALGKPVIATRSGGIPEIVANGVNGLLVEPRDVPALTAAIDRLLRDSAERNRLGAAGRRIAADHHPGRCAQRLLAVLG